MAEPDYYMDLGVDPKASQQEIEKVYGKRVAELRVSKVEMRRRSWQRLKQLTLSCAIRRSAPVTMRGLRLQTMRATRRMRR